MTEEKGRSNSVYAALISVSLLAAIVLLSTTVDSTQGSNVLKDGFSLPGDGPGLPGAPGVGPGNTAGPSEDGNLTGGNRSQDGPGTQRSGTGSPGNGIFEKAARAVFRVLGGALEGLSPGSPERSSGMKGNFSEPGNISNGTQGTGNGSKGEPGGPANLTDPAGPQENRSTGGQGRGGEGLMNSLLERASGVFRDLFTGGGSAGRSENGKESGSGGSGGKKGSGNVLPDTGPVLPFLGLIGLMAALLIVYRSDSSPRELLRMLARKLRLFLLGIPDLFRRTIVGAVNSFISIAASMVRKFRKLISSPRLFLEKLRQKWRKRFQKVGERKEELGDRGVKDYLKRRLGDREDELEGIDRVWLRLKQDAGVDRRTSLTPREVGSKAREVLPGEKVREIVEAFRLEKYSSRGFSDRSMIERWLEELEADEDE